MVLSSTLTDIGFVDAAVVALPATPWYSLACFPLMIVVIGMGKIFIAARRRSPPTLTPPRPPLPLYPEWGPAADAPAAPGTAGKLKLYDVEPKPLCLAAIVADKMASPNELRFISH